MFISSDTGSGSQNWGDYTLVLPTVSVGNVGQLACDVLIATLCPRHAGYLYDDCVLPVVGNDPFGNGTGRITTALEVYESPEHKLVIVQQRAPVMMGKKSNFVDRLFDWIRTCHFKQIFMLTSVFAHERKDAQLVGPQTRFIATPEALQQLPNVENRTWIPLEQRCSSDDVVSSVESELFIPGSGITKSLYNKCLSANVSAFALLIFSAEGDNISDALVLSSFCNSFNNWIAPEQQALPLLDPKKHSPVKMTTEETIYGEAKSYWESVPATVSGMLGGFTQINSVDLAASNKFIRHFTQGNKPAFKPVRAVDCGCGIGRVTKRLLLPLFQTVDMVDISQSFIDEARNYLGPESSRVDKLICSSLHHFVPEQGRYDAIWCQWVLGQLTEDDLIAFFRRCKAGLTNNGILFVKENMGSSDQPVFDEQDRAWTRPRAVWLDLVHRAGLKVVKEEKQPSFPKDLYEVRMFAIQ